MSPNSNFPSPLAFEPEPIAAVSDELPLSDIARETLLRRVEAWIDEEERLVAEIARQLEGAAGKVLVFPQRATSKGAPRSRRWRRR
jgi:hypothetical protein